MRINHLQCEKALKHTVHVVEGRVMPVEFLFWYFCLYDNVNGLLNGFLRTKECSRALLREMGMLSIKVVFN